MTEAYGIPREGPYYQTDKSRFLFALPFCHESKRYEDEIDYSESEIFYNKHKEKDNGCDTDEFRVMLFGERNVQTYEFQPLVRTPLGQEYEQRLKFYDKINVDACPKPPDNFTPS